MDKHEFNIKVDQIKKMVSKGDFETAMKIADTIDWRRVRNANLLSMISSVYEKNAEYQEAKDILLIAFERAPIGKRLLYKLTQLALKEGDIGEAESYYREFCDLAGDDSRQDILRYLILKAKGAPIEQLIHSLESYTSIELDEKWLYELADLYHQAGREEDCVRTCDKIMLMFGLGQYVDKAMELKLQYAPLTKYQMDLVENRDKYEEKLRQVEQNGVSAVSLGEAASREVEEMAAAARRGQVAAMEAMPSYSETAIPSPVIEADPVSQVAIAQADEVPQVSHSGNAEQAREEEMVSNIAASFAAAAVEPSGTCVSPEERLEVSMKEAEAEASLAQEMSKLSMDGFTEEPVREKTRVLQNVKDLKKADEPTEKTKVLDEIRHIQPVKPAEEQSVPEKPRHLMVEARETEKGLEIAIASLKKAHQLLAYKHPVAKIGGEKLNQKGILASASKLTGKDLIVENAGDLCDAMLDELDKLLAGDKSGMLVVLVDNPRQLEGIRRISPSLADKFCVVTCVEEAEQMFLRAAGGKTSRQTMTRADAAAERQPVEQRETSAARPSAAQREVSPVRPSAAQRETPPVRPSAVQRETPAAHSSAAQRETSPVRPSAVQRETSPARPLVSEREAAAARQPELQGGELAGRQTAAQRESVPVRPLAVQRETVPVQQPVVQRKPATIQQPVVPQREMSPVRQMPASEGMVSEKASLSASGNIVQLRNPSSASADERLVMESGGERMDEPDDGRTMDIDEFAQYCCHYASQIDCNISGKSMLALYERIEIMEEDGIALTKTAAEDLIEEAADRAEKPSLGKRIAGLFSSKYDKEGLLILKEEHFIS